MDAEGLRRKLETICGLAQGLANITNELMAELSAPKEEEAGPTNCPSCGSPNLTNVSGMGDPEFKCNDCNTITKGELVT